MYNNVSILLHKVLGLIIGEVVSEKVWLKENGGLSKLTTAILYLSWAAISDSIGIGYTPINRTICFLSKSAYKIIF